MARRIEDCVVIFSINVYDPGVIPEEREKRFLYFCTCAEMMSAKSGR